MTGLFSGIVGATLSPSRDAYAAWVESVNARGGIDGHRIELLTADDGNSAAQDLANARTFVEKYGAIALVNFNPAPGGAAAVDEYARKKHVPIVGGNNIEPIFNQSPVIFPVTPSSDTQDYSWAAAMNDAGKKKVAALYCTEGQACADKEANWKKYAQQLGMQVVYDSRASVAQPDFTANCIAARSAGAEAMVPVLDSASQLRVARDCDRQGYRPMFIAPGPFPQAPSYIEGMVATLQGFPWFLTSGSPVLEEYGTAMRKYVTSQITAVTPQGWVAGKALERALQLAGVSNPPTPKDVFKGLYALNGDTLGGITPPLRFVEGKASPEMRCMFVAKVVGGKWIAPIGLQLTYCKP
jgi:branched-chain amino acid transport system substrate-binding protein